MYNVYPALESSASVSATDGQIDSWRAVLLYQLLKQDTSQQTKQTNKQTAKLPASWARLNILMMKLQLIIFVPNFRFPQ